jgi:hypothetical protein
MLATLGLVAAVFVGVAAPSSAAAPQYKPLTNGTNSRPAPKGSGDVRPMTTGGTSFMEINNDGKLVYWHRTQNGTSFFPSQRGQGWGNTRLITTLTDNVFLEVKDDGRLSTWTWNGSFYSEAAVGTDWWNVRLVTGISATKFLAVTTNGSLNEWTFGPGNQLSVHEIGQSGWGNARMIAGIDDLDFIEIKQNGAMSEWIELQGQGLTELPWADSGFSDVRLMAGEDFYHFLIIDGPSTNLYEFTYSDAGANSGWYPDYRGTDWGKSRLIG